MAISFDPNLQGLVGLAVTLAGGFGVACLVKEVSDAIKLPPPANANEAMRKAWADLIGQTTGGRWIGHVERPLFFAALWWQPWWFLISSWLVFKLAFYWQGANFTTFPEKQPSAAQLGWIAAKRQLGTHHVATALVGTAANIVVAIVGVAIGRWIRL